MFKYDVPIKSIDLARDLYYKENPNLGRSTMSDGFHQHLRVNTVLRTLFMPIVLLIVEIVVLINFALLLRQNRLQHSFY